MARPLRLLGVNEVWADSPLVPQRFTGTRFRADAAAAPPRRRGRGVYQNRRPSLVTLISPGIAGPSHRFSIVGLHQFGGGGARRSPRRVAVEWPLWPMMHHPVKLPARSSLGWAGLGWAGPGRAGL
ncbi:hypothetical protein AAFF_G00018110 [Aldrovandia affinis]|uniref:Uncharacterized protein n=1 Tax=Aldrovandia affinis TaxID=143900 RepID=A0AAD7S5T5_9TELE|nr:hypothetical protein AAFF_G00018110 [Aldrovandia affinis]